MENNQQFGQSENLPRPIANCKRGCIHITHQPQPCLRSDDCQGSYPKHSHWQKPTGSPSRFGTIYQVQQIR